MKQKNILRKKFFIFLVAALSLFLLTTIAYSYKISCRSVIFSDATKVKRLYGKNVHLKVLPASTTKVMTALIVLEHLSLDQYVSVR